MYVRRYACFLCMVMVAIVITTAIMSLLLGSIVVVVSIAIVTSRAAAAAAAVTASSLVTTAPCLRGRRYTIGIIGESTQKNLVLLRCCDVIRRPWGSSSRR